MTGYAPVFDSLTTGTLCGKWPDIGLWPIVLAMADKHGVLDVTAAYISGVTGLAVEEVTACMARFCEPDPFSRTATQEGRRLMLLEPERRNWGWRVVNHGLYRERARLMAKNQREVETGRNAARLEDRRRPPETAGFTCDPPATASDPLSESYAYADTSSEHARAERSPTDASSEGRARTANRGSRIPEPFMLTSSMREWAKSETPDVDLTAATAEFVDYWRGVPGQKGCKLDWPGTWRNRMREQQARIAAGRPTPAKRAKTPAAPRCMPDAFDVARKGSGG